jgi:hypothetical protein
MKARPPAIGVKAARCGEAHALGCAPLNPEVVVRLIAAGFARADSSYYGKRAAQGRIRGEAFS